MSNKIQYDRVKAEALAACQMDLQQIADVLDIDLKELSQDMEQMAEFRGVVRKGKVKGEAEIRAALFKLARQGDTFAIRELLKTEKSQDFD